MRRTTRKVLVNLILFTTALTLIIYVGHSSSSPSNKAFQWTHIQYRTTAASLPEPRGICPGLNETSKPALVVSRVEVDGSADWLDPLKDHYHLCIYTVDAPRNETSTSLQVPANRGHEAMTYLTFLIDNYASMPPSGAIFIHGSRFAWHNDHKTYDNLPLLITLNTTAALQPYGYHNLRCDWSESTCPSTSGPPQGSLETNMNAVLEPWNLRAVSDAALPKALITLFGGVDATSDVQVHLGRSDAIRAQCCAQFVVARENVWLHAREEYVALRQWLLDDGVAPEEDRVSGRVLSYLWHILFLRDESSHGLGGGGGGVVLDKLNRLACPSAEECYCKLYGRCGLEGCENPGRCEGEYVSPPDLRLPADWGVRHS